MHMVVALLIVAGLALGGAIPAARAAVERVPLPALNVDPASVSVSGVSSGGSMAMQLGVAYSAQIMGVGVFAGYPYDCWRTDTRRDCTGQNTPELGALEANMRAWSGREIDAVANIARQRIYVFVGAYDAIGGTTVSAQVVALYARFAPAANIAFESTVPAYHTFPTDFDHPLSNFYKCNVPQVALANCGFDAAGATLQWIYGPLAPRTAGQPTGRLVAVDQREFIRSDLGMDETAWLYVPTRCAAGNACRLHVFLHACGQSYFQRGDTLYANYSGHARWAETNGIVLLFPQTYPDPPQNDGCWDTERRFGDDYDQKGGVQMAAIMKMVARITSGFQAPPTAVEYHHAEWDHYFVTASADEIGKLDAGVFAGWARTGQSFAVYPLGTAGAADVCRFFSTSFAPRSSHFYTASAGECAAVKQNPDWQFEATVFAVGVPDAAGACAPGTQPLYRLYNDGQGGAPNHRYTTSAATRAAMLDRKWVPEGVGAGVIGCVPL